MDQQGFEVPPGDGRYAGNKKNSAEYVDSVPIQMSDDGETITLTRGADTAEVIFRGEVPLASKLLPL